MGSIQAFARSTRHYSSAGETVDPAAEKEKAAKRIENMVKDNRVMLFMKGTKIFPQCGFSNTAVQVLRAVDCDFYTFDVLSDPFIREGVKQYSEWPTIPQLYVNGEFVGGDGVVSQKFKNGELKELLGNTEFLDADCNFAQSSIL